MKAFTVSVREDSFKILDQLAKKHNVSRSKIAKALITIALKDKEVMQKAMDIL